MTMIGWSIIFGLIWVAISGGFSLANMVLGTVFGCLSVYFFRHQSKPMVVVFKPFAILSLSGLFAYELMMSALRIATLVMRPNMNLKPGIFAFETALKSDRQVTLLANLITLTPGTLTVDVSIDRRILYIHAMDCSDVEANCKDIRDGFERKIMEAFGD